MENFYLPLRFESTLSLEKATKYSEMHGIVAFLVTLSEILASSG